MDDSEDSNLSDEENYSEELDSDESSGKDWSDLEAEAAESDENRFMSTYVRLQFGDTDVTLREKNRYNPLIRIPDG